MFLNEASCELDSLFLRLSGLHALTGLAGVFISVKKSYLISV